MAKSRRLGFLWILLSEEVRFTPQLNTSQPQRITFYKSAYKNGLHGIAHENEDFEKNISLHEAQIFPLALYVDSYFGESL